jgi:tripartite ATP-independent transporter DctM subunit
MPVAFAIGISGFIFFLQNPNLPITIPIQLSVSQAQNFALLAVPMFILAGNLMNGAGITRRLLDLSNVLVGHMRGSLAQVNVLLSTLMGGVSGSCIADTAMECRMLGPEMMRRGYSRGYTVAVNVWTSLITPIIPPGIGFILYGTVGQVSIGRLFAGGIGPGIALTIVPPRPQQISIASIWIVSIC